MIDSVLMAVYFFVNRMSMSFSVNETLLPRSTIYLASGTFQISPFSFLCSYRRNQGENFFDIIGNIKYRMFSLIFIITIFNKIAIITAIIIKYIIY